MKTPDRQRRRLRRESRDQRRHRRGAPARNPDQREHDGGPACKRRGGAPRRRAPGARCRPARGDAARPTACRPRKRSSSASSSGSPSSPAGCRRTSTRITTSTTTSVCSPRSWPWPSATGCRCAATAGCATSRGSTGSGAARRIWRASSPDAFAHIVATEVGEGFNELCCHPGYVDEELASSSYAASGVPSWTRCAIRRRPPSLSERGIRLATFREVHDRMTRVVIATVRLLEFMEGGGPLLGLHAVRGGAAAAGMRGLRARQLHLVRRGARPATECGSSTTAWRATACRTA